MYPGRYDDAQARAFIHSMVLNVDVFRAPRRAIGLYHGDGAGVVDVKACGFEGMVGHEEGGGRSV